MEELAYSVKSNADGEQGVALLPWQIANSETLTDLDLVDFRTMLEELEYK